MFESVLYLFESIYVYLGLFRSICVFVYVGGCLYVGVALCVLVYVYVYYAMYVFML